MWWNMLKPPGPDDCFYLDPIRSHYNKLQSVESIIQPDQPSHHVLKKTAEGKQLKPKQTITPDQENGENVPGEKSLEK